MPVITIQFSLPDEAVEYKVASQASNYLHALESYSQDFLRANTKHGVQDSVLRAIRFIIEEYRTADLPVITDEVLLEVVEATLEHARTVFHDTLADSLHDIGGL